MAVPRKTAPPAVPAVNFGALTDYSAGGSFDLPEGDYAVSYEARLHAYTKNDGTRGMEMLGVMGTFYPLGGGHPIDVFLSLGKNAIRSYAPNPETGKGLIAIPGGEGKPLAGNTNWHLHLKSLYDSGMPEETFTNDLSVLDGIHVHAQSVPEPEERKSFGRAKTGEMDQQEERRDRKIAVITAILAAPWENAGGLPEDLENGFAEPAAPSKTVGFTPKVQTAAAPKGNGKAPAKASAPVSDEDEIRKLALSGIASVLEANPKGCAKLKLRTGTFKAIEGQNPELVQAVVDTFFGPSSDEELNGLLNELGYGLNGSTVVAQ